MESPPMIQIGLWWDANWEWGTDASGIIIYSDTSGGTSWTLAPVDTEVMRQVLSGEDNG